VPLVLFLASSLSFSSYLASFGERRMKGALRTLDEVGAEI
jgi:hypothetical protein